MVAAVVHTKQTELPTNVEELRLRQQASEFRIPEFSPPWTHHIHPAMETAKRAAEKWAGIHFLTLAGSERFRKIMESSILELLVAGMYCTGAGAEGLEYGMEYILFVFVLDDEVLHRSKSPLPEGHENVRVTGVAEIFLELVLVMMSSFPREKALEEALETILAVDEKWGIVNRNRIEKFLARAVQHPGTVDFSDELVEVSPITSAITSAFRNLWKRATTVMPEDWNLRFAYMSQRDMLAMFKETHDGILGITTDSVSEYIQQRRKYGFAESSMVVGEFTEGIHVSSVIYYNPPMQRLIQATNDIVMWENDIHSFQKELLAGEVNLVHLISKREGCSYNRAGEIVNGMVVERCQDLSLAAAGLRHHAALNEENSLYPDIENAEKYIDFCTNFISATHDFLQRSARYLFKV